MAKPLICPVAVRYLGELASVITRLGDHGIELDKASAAKAAELTKSIMAAVGRLDNMLTKHFMSIEEHMRFCAKTICPLMDEVRQSADALEGEVADDLWPLPTYQEMLFIK